MGLIKKNVLRTFRSSSFKKWKQNAHNTSKKPSKSNRFVVVTPYTLSCQSKPIATHGCFQPTIWHTLWPRHSSKTSISNSYTHLSVVVVWTPHPCLFPPIDRYLLLPPFGQIVWVYFCTLRTTQVSLERWRPSMGQASVAITCASERTRRFWVTPAVSYGGKTRKKERFSNHAWRVVVMNAPGFFSSSSIAAAPYHLKRSLLALPSLVDVLDRKPHHTLGGGNYKVQTHHSV